LGLRGEFIRGQMGSIEHIERAGIERGIRECNYLLEMISEERVRLAIDLNECDLMRHLLAIRPSCPRNRLRNPLAARLRWGSV
jgi:hypothetical protein